MPHPTIRTRNRSYSGAQAYSPREAHQHHTPLAHHASAVHQPTSADTPPLGMSSASRYAHNLKVLRRRDPSILRIFDQFSHVCVYHHNGKQWEKKGFEGSMFLYERADYPPYGFYILNRMGMDDYIQRLWPEDNVGVHGNYLMLRTWPEWSRKRVGEIESAVGGSQLDPFDERYKWDGSDPPKEDKTVSQTIGLWMFTTDSREPMITVMMRLHDFIKQNLPYPEEFRYGPDKPPPTNQHSTPIRTPSAASTGSGVSAASSSHTGSLSASSSQRHSPSKGYMNPLLYQVTDSTSVASTTLQPVEETPKKANARNRKGKKAKMLAASGDVTPMANGSQASDLDLLFAKLVKPAESKSISTEEGASLMETLLGSSSSSNLIPSPSHSLDTTQVTLESLFASALDSSAQLHGDGSIRSGGSVGVHDGQGSHTTSSNTGLALLNDIFASASKSSVNAPSTSRLDEHMEYPASDLPANSLAEVDQPETIEIHSPRPQAPLSLASMFDAAAANSSSPTKVSGLGLNLGQIEHADLPAQSVNGSQLNPDILFDSLVVQDEPEEVRRTLLDMIGLGSKIQPSSSSHIPASGDATPRVVAHAPRAVVDPSPATSSHFVAPAYGEDEDEDEEEPIVELDFSDTRALSDLHVFESRERALREQLNERKAASRSATPSIASLGPAQKVTNGMGSKASGLAGEPRCPPTSVTVSSQSVHFDAESRPSRATPVPTLQNHDCFATSTTPPVTSSTKKKTRRGRGRGKDKDKADSRESSPVSDVRNGTAISSAIVEVTLSHRGGILSKGEEKLHELTAEEPSQSIVKDSLISALSSTEVRAENKKTLVEVTLRLLQTDAAFVDQFWNSWRLSKSPSLVPESTSSDISIPAALLPSSESLVTAPPLELTHSAPASLPTLADESTSQTPYSETDIGIALVPPMVKDVASILEAESAAVDSSVEQRVTPEVEKEEQSSVVESML